MNLPELVGNFESLIGYKLVKNGHLSILKVHGIESFLTLFLWNLAQLLLKLGDNASRVFNILGQIGKLLTLFHQAYQITVILFHLFIF